MGNSDERAVLEAARRAILEARQTAPSYAARSEGASTAEISKLLVRTNTVLVERRFRSTVKGMAFERVGGGHVIAIDSACSRADLSFTLRHELAHVLRGEATEPTYLTSADELSHAERVADLFAIADLTPTPWMKWMRQGRRPWKHLVLEVAQGYRELTDGWSERRLWDRAQLRVRLYREHGI